MGLLNVFSGKKATEHDPTEGRAFILEASDAARVQDWEEVTSLYRQIPTASDKYAWLHTLSRMLPIALDLPTEAETSDLACILAELHTNRGFRIRGGETADRVETNAFFDMRDCLHIAEKLVLQAEAASPEDSVPTIIHFNIALGLSADENAVDDIQKKYHACSEQSVFAPSNLLMLRTEKWLGSRDEMWAVATNYTEAPPNSAWYALRAKALIEDSLWFSAFEDDQDAIKSYRQLRRDGTLQEELKAIESKFWEGLETSTPPASEKLFAHNHFAWILYQFGMKEDARRHFEVIGPTLTYQPWCYSFPPDENPIASLNKIRKRLSLPPFLA